MTANPGRTAAIHNPNTPRTPVWLLDFIKERPQCFAIRRIAGQHLVSQRQAFRRDHQRNYHLRTIRPLVTAVTVTAPSGRSAALISKYVLVRS
jgi:hypothetical protein